MSIIDALDQILHQRRRDGVTNKEMATQAGCSQPHINDILNHTKKKKKHGESEELKEVSLADLKFETLLNLFPEVRRVLEEHFCKGASTSVGHAVNGNSNHVEGNITTNAASPADIAAAVDSALAHAADAVMQSSMCDACKLLAYPLIRAAARISQ